MAAGAVAARLLAAPRAERLGMIAAHAAYRQANLARLLALCAAAQLDAPPVPVAGSISAARPPSNRRPHP